jgi:hypothetical protein
MKARIIWIVVIIAVLVGGVLVLRRPSAVSSPVATADTTVFTDSAKTFSFLYPNIFSATTTADALAEVDIPRSYMPMTNFAEAKFAVLVSGDATIVANCLTPTNGEKSLGQTNINGLTFTKITLSDAGAGNFYDVTNYRVLRNAQCYAVELIIHSTNIGNYSPDQGITQFDENKIQGMLDGIVQTFKFL